MTTAVGDPGGGGMGGPIGPGDPAGAMNGQQQPDGGPGNAFFPSSGGGGMPDELPPVEKKPMRRVGAKPPPDRAPRSIYCFSVKNPLRKRIIELGRFLSQSCCLFVQFHFSKVIII